MSANPLHVNAAELLREPGLRRHVSAIVPAIDVAAEHAAVDGDVVVEVDLVSTLDDIGLSGTIAVPWRGHCRRCLRPLAETLVVDVDERYAERRDHDAFANGHGDAFANEHSEAFAIEHRQIDLAPMVREHVLLEVDDPRLCRPDCPGLCPSCGADLGSGLCQCDDRLVDERWSVLDQLRSAEPNP